MNPETEQLVKYRIGRAEEAVCQYNYFKNGMMKSYKKKPVPR